MPELNVGSFCATALKAPRWNGATCEKGVLILNQVDRVLAHFPWLKSTFILIEIRGWYGINESTQADIKLVEDNSTLVETRRQFPQAIILDLGFGDFVDTDAFRPIDTNIDFDVIQIASWTPRKRFDLLVETAAMLPAVRFVQFGHFENNCSATERAYFSECVEKARRLNANITFPYTPEDWLAKRAPTTKELVNDWINRTKIGLLTTSSEGHNRFKMECFSANRPVVGCNDICAPTRKYFNRLTGELVAPRPDALAAAVLRVLKNVSTFSPRDYVLRHSGKRRSLTLVKQALALYCRRENISYRFDDIEWDGRNRSLAWSHNALAVLRHFDPSCRGK